MTYTPTRETLELAALACGIPIPNGEDYYQLADGSIVIGYDHSGDEILWQPHLPTTQGKADLLDMMLAADISYGREEMYMDAWIEGTKFYECTRIEKGNKHAALAEAALKVAAQVGAKIKE